MRAILQIKRSILKVNNSIYKIGNITKVSDKYEIRDDYSAEGFVLSSTLLYPSCETNGHKHTTQDEVFIFYGKGEMYLRYPDEGQGEIEAVFSVKNGSTITVLREVFHRVKNTTKNENLLYLRVMSK